MKLKLALAGAAALALTLLGAVSAQAMAAPATSALTTAAAASAPAGFVRLTGTPERSAVNPATHTLYVPIGCTKLACSNGAFGDAVDIIDTATCNVAHLSGCRVVATAKVGGTPNAVVIDPGTDTVYVTSGGDSDGAVSVFNGARCNARATSGCTRPVAVIKLRASPSDGVVSPLTHTLYAADDDGVAMINTAKCDAHVSSGCGAKPKNIDFGLLDFDYPMSVDVDSATGTLYVLGDGDALDPSEVAVINGATCNTSTVSGCDKQSEVQVGVDASSLAVDQSTDTVYVANHGSEVDDPGSDVRNGGSVAVINGKACDTRPTSGCKVTAYVPTGTGTGQVAVDTRRHTAFAVNAGDDTLSAINTRTCNGTVTAGCHHRPRTVRATALGGPGRNSSVDLVTLDPDSGTLYVMSDSEEFTVLSVDSAGSCNAIVTAGCRAEAPRAADHDFLVTADPATHTIYASSLTRPLIDVLSSATCHAGDLSGCAPVATIPVRHRGASVGAIDQATHTLYASDPARPTSDDGTDNRTPGTLAVINIAACNATDTTGCAKPVATLKVGASPGAPVIDPATHTVYVAYQSTIDTSLAARISVVSTVTCNATDTAGCAKPAGKIWVPSDVGALAVSIATNTVYATVNTGNGPSRGDKIAVISGASCDAAHPSGCGHPVATALVGVGPAGIVVNDATHTVYVLNSDDYFLNNPAGFGAPGTVSVLNTATCDGTHTRGCRGTFPVMATGAAPANAALDPASGLLYVTDEGSATVTELSTGRCNAEVTTGCGQAGRQQAVGSSPIGLVISGGSVYVGQAYLKGSMSVFRG